SAGLDRHGLTAKVTKDIQTGDDPKTAEKSRLALRRLIKHHAAFAAEYLAAQDKVGGGQRPGEARIKLADLKVAGEKATGTMVVDFGGGRGGGFGRGRGQQAPRRVRQDRRRLEDDPGAAPGREGQVGAPAPASANPERHSLHLCPWR